MTTTEKQLTLTEPETPAESRRAKDLRALCRFWFADLDLAEQVALLNELRGVLGEFSPFQSEPVDRVEWVPTGLVQANAVLGLPVAEVSSAMAAMERAGHAVRNRAVGRQSGWHRGTQLPELAAIPIAEMLQQLTLFEELVVTATDYENVGDATVKDPDRKRPVR